MAGEKSMLVRLKDLGRAVADPDQDVRGRNVNSTNGEGLGTVEGLLVDVDEEKVRLLRVNHGGILGFGTTPSFIPVDAVAEVKKDEVVVDLTKERLEGAPRYDPELTDQRPFYENLYEYYGYAPFWGPDYVYPDFTSTTDPSAQPETESAEHDKGQR